MFAFKARPAMLRACGWLPVLAFCLAGCSVDDLLDVSDPSRLAEEDVEVPSQANTLMNGVEADFICAIGAYIQVTADLSDEFEDTNSQGNSWTLDRRQASNLDPWGDNGCTARLPSAYVPASKARWVADNLVRLLEAWTDQQVDARQEKIARSSLLAAFSAYMLGAAHCSAALDEGPELTSMEVFAEAESRFSRALEVAQSQGLSEIENAARVGRARVRLFMGDEQGALSDAQAVDEGFVMNVYPSDATNRLWNRVWDANLYSFDFGVPEWSRNLTTGGVIDPRTATHDTGYNSGWSPGNVWVQEKYSSVGTPIPIARWEEAQLIIAEIEGGQVAVDIINALRAPWNLPEFSSTDESEIQDMVIAERRRELWFEGHRAYDIHRLNLPLYPPAGTPYQPNLKGGTYGDQTCIPMPVVESFNNETIRGGG